MCNYYRIPYNQEKQKNKNKVTVNVTQRVTFKKTSFHSFFLICKINFDNVFEIKNLILLQN